MLNSQALQEVVTAIEIILRVGRRVSQERTERQEENRNVTCKVLHHWFKLNHFPPHWNQR